MTKTKCNECDERGYIVDKAMLPNHSAHSCKCGWAIEQSMKQFEGVDIMDLLAYGHKRALEKGKQN